MDIRDKLSLYLIVTRAKCYSNKSEWGRKSYRQQFLGSLILLGPVLELYLSSVLLQVRIFFYYFTKY